MRKFINIIVAILFIVFIFWATVWSNIELLNYIFGLDSPMLAFFISFVCTWCLIRFFSNVKNK